jgi:hypothetical protein
VDEQLRLVVGSRLKEDFQNGKSYYPSHGLKLQLPSTIDDHPGSDFLTWHREKRFVG